MILSLPHEGSSVFTENCSKSWLQPNNIASTRYINYLLFQNESVSPKDPFDECLQNTEKNHKISYWPSTHCCGERNAISLEPGNIGASFSDKLRGWWSIKSERQTRLESLDRVHTNLINNIFIFYKYS